MQAAKPTRRDEDVVRLVVDFLTRGEYSSILVAADVVRERGLVENPDKAIRPSLLLGGLPDDEQTRENARLLLETYARFRSEATTGVERGVENTDGPTCRTCGYRRQGVPDTCTNDAVSKPHDVGLNDTCRHWAPWDVVRADEDDPLLFDPCDHVDANVLLVDGEATCGRCGERLRVEVGEDDRIDEEARDDA